MRGSKVHRLRRLFVEVVGRAPRGPVFGERGISRIRYRDGGEKVAPPGETFFTLPYTAKISEWRWLKRHANAAIADLEKRKKAKQVSA